MDIFEYHCIENELTDLYREYIRLINFFCREASDDELLTRSLLEYCYYILDEHYGELLLNDGKIYSYRCDDEMRMNFFIDSNSYLVSSRVYKIHAQSLINTEYGSPMTRKEVIELLCILKDNIKSMDISPTILPILDSYNKLEVYL